MKSKKNEAIELLEQSVIELEKTKGSVLSSIQILKRAAKLIDNQEILIWCNIQLGDKNYTDCLEELIQFALEHNGIIKEKDFQPIKEKLDKLKITEIHYTNEELNIKANESGGKYSNIGFIEEKYSDLVRTKRGNDGTYYKNNLHNHIVFVRKKAHELASNLYNELKYSETTSNCFDILKNAIDDKLLDLNPEIAEQMMVSFKSISSTNSEEWSHSLTSCRRLIEGLADELFPPQKENINGRPLGKTNYINRIWAFMDEKITSKSNKDIGKAHIDYLGSYLEKINRLANKGVHSDVTQIEAIKTVFHLYLIVADLLEFIDISTDTSKKLDIYTASIDELEAILDINRSIAKEIIKIRVRNDVINTSQLLEIKGIGKKTIEKIKSEFDIE